MTARLVVSIQPHRDLAVRWRPISLLLKNQPDPESKYYAGVAASHGLLRVMEAVRSSEGDAAAGQLYVEYGRRIHHDREQLVDASGPLIGVGLDPDLASAADDSSWDSAIQASMDDGLALVGDDVGTPIIAWHRSDGCRVGIFGPVISRVPPLEEALRLWDATITLTEADGFWELKRSRTEPPEFGPRP